MTTNVPESKREPFTLRGFLRMLRETLVQWSGGHAFVYAAALAYYTIFSIVPLVALLVNVGGYFAGAYNLERQVVAIIARQNHETSTAVDTTATTDQLLSIVRQRAGEVPAEFVSQLIDGQTQSTSSTSATVVSVLVLLWGASTVFHQLLNSLNAMYGLPDAYTSIRHGILYYAIARLLSAAVVVIVGVLFVLLLAVNVVLSALPPTHLEIYMADFPGTQALLRYVVAPLIATVVIGAIYKYLPDGRMRWRDVLPGTVLTVLLIAVGNRILGFYLERIFGATLYGASGTVVLFLIWVYYISMIVLFGAKFIALYCRRYGVPITPKLRLLPSRVAQQ